MGIEKATGRSRCNECKSAIPKGVLCWRQDVNARARPFFCSSCIGRMHRLVSGETKLVPYYLHVISGVRMLVREGELLQSPSCAPVGVGRDDGREPAPSTHGEWLHRNRSIALKIIALAEHTFGKGRIKFSHHQRLDKTNEEHAMSFDVEVAIVIYRIRDLSDGEILALVCFDPRPMSVSSHCRTASIEVDEAEKDLETEKMHAPDAEIIETPDQLRVWIKDTLEE